MWCTFVRQTFLLTDARGHEYVVRKQPPGKLLPGAHAVDREYTIMTALDGFLPVPKTHHLCLQEDVIGTKFFV